MNKPSVVIIGAGFAGLHSIKKLSKLDVEVTLIDKNNYHTFYPLLYQVSAAELTSEQIAFPVRSFLRGHDKVKFLMGEVIDLDSTNKTIFLKNGMVVAYDYLVIATGTEPFYFNIEGAKEHCYTIDSLENGEILRNRVLTTFEKAAKLENTDKIRQLLKFAIIGAGPTGTEYATALSELIHGPLKKDFPELDIDLVEIVLIEALDKVLPMLESDKISQKTIKALDKRQITVNLNATVNKIDENRIHLSSGETIDASTKIWTAGVKGSPIFKEWKLPTNKRNLIEVEQTLQVRNQEFIFAIGDIAQFYGDDVEKVPNLAPAAIQMGKHVSKNIENLLKDKPMEEFSYKDKGHLIVLGRYDAVARLWGKEFSGFFAWMLWGIVHIFNLIGFRNRLFVFINWLWDLIRFEKVERLIIGSDEIKKEELNENLNNIY